MKKIILITGASSGMGKVTAMDLIARGHTVYCAARNVKAMEDLEKAGGRVLPMDVSEESEITRGIDRIIKEVGKIDVLWNNAGFGLYGPIEEIPLEKARYQFEVNLFGLAALTQKVLPFMRERKSGLIINTSSVGGKIYSPLGGWYHATKHALEGWSDCLRLELKSFGIDVVVLEPGLIETGFTGGVAHNLPKESLSGPYKDLVESIMRSTGMKGSPASLMSRTVQKIINARKPKTRYMAGKLGRPLVIARHVLGDKNFDRVIMSQVK